MLKPSPTRPEESFRIYGENLGITRAAELWHEQCNPQRALTTSFLLQTLRGSLNLKTLHLAYSRLHHRGLVDQPQAGHQDAGLGGGDALAQGGQPRLLWLFAVMPLLFGPKGPGGPEGRRGLYPMGCELDAVAQEPGPEGAITWASLPWEVLNPRTLRVRCEM